jgi:membrane fusion protein (multidrug efflux system)
MFKRFLIAFVLVVLVCGGLVGFNLFRAKMIAGFFASQKMPSVTVSATRIEPVTWQPDIEAIGTLWAYQGVDVASQMAGMVKTIAFQANQAVAVGQLLVQIDDAVERADLQSAKAALERDRASLTRAQTLSKTGVSSAATLDEAESNLAASESALNRIQATIDRKAIDAPFSGTVGIPRVDVGQYVQPGTVIATLQQLTRMKADFTVPEQRLADVKMGQTVSFAVSGDEFRYKGTILGIDPKVDPQTRLFSVRAVVNNPGFELRPGQFVRIRVELPEVAGVIAVPQTSVVTSLYGDYVYVVEQAAPDPAPASDAAQPAGQPQSKGPQLKARQVFVQIGRRQGNLIEIASGLEPGQTVVTSGQNKLANNAPVTIDNKVDPAAIALQDGDGKT